MNELASNSSNSRIHLVVVYISQTLPLRVRYKGRTVQSLVDNCKA